MAPSGPSHEAFFKGGPGAELLATLDESRIPRHVAIIMDGNGRWAARRALPRLAGHRAGAKAVREVVEAAVELGIEYLTVYSFSSENWSRPAEEVSGLMSLFVEVLEREFEDLKRNGVRIVLAGRRAEIPQATRDAFAAAEQETASNDRLTLIVAINYGGRAELTDAVRAIAQEVVSGHLAVGDIDEETIEGHLYTAEIPDPDLLVRTSGELRVSNFLLWQIAYAEIWVTDTLWPDFDRHELLKAVIDFQKRDRRFGGR